MTITLVFLVIIMATVIGWLLRQTINQQPWIANAADDEFSGTSLDTSTRAIGLATFLAVATSLFALFVSAYSLRMEEPDWTPITEPRLLWFNTVILVLASIAYQWARSAAVKGTETTLRTALTAAGVLTLVFLAGQLVVWRELDQSGAYALSNPAYAFFFLLTAVHGLHMLGGMWVWGRSVTRVWGGASADSVRSSVELCTVYWHFLLLVWAVIFGLLLST